MKVIITNNAYNDINEYIHFSKSNDNTIRSYIISLLNFAYGLGKFPYMGKADFTIKTKMYNYSIRKLVYRQHKILYYVDDNVHILGIVHSKMNLTDYMYKLKNILK